MKGKFLIVLLGLVFCLCVFLVESKSIHAEEWTAEQKDVLKSVDKLISANLQGNVQEIMSCFHPKFSGWLYSQKSPINKDTVHKIIEATLKEYKITKFDVEPLEIQVEGNTAILHLNFDEIRRDSTGKETSVSGPWSATMLKQDNEWLFLSWSWIEK